MAYLHCHSCGWSQDDFYSKTYNLWTKIKNDIRWLGKPHIEELDTWIIEDITRFVGFKVPVIRKLNKYGFHTSYKVFSWFWLPVEIVKDIKNYRNTKWKTYKIWKRNRHSAVCPNCGKKNFDID